MAGRPQDDEDEKEKVADEDDGKSGAIDKTWTAAPGQGLRAAGPGLC